MNICGQCNSSNTIVETDSKPFTWQGKQIPFKRKYVACLNCGFEFVPFGMMQDAEQRKQRIKKLYS